MDNPNDSCINTYSRISTADTNAVAVKAAPGFLHGLDCSNINAAARYLKIYDKATTPAETDTPKLRYALPAGATGQFREITFPKPVRFLNGIGVRLVTGIADNDTAAVSASEHLLNLYYD